MKMADIVGRNFGLIRRFPAQEGGCFLIALCSGSLGDTPAAASITLRELFSVADLRGLVRGSWNTRHSRRLLALALVAKGRTGSGRPALVKEWRQAPA